MTRLVLAAVVAAVAAWLSQGTVAVATPLGPRIALLPVSLAGWSVVAVVALAIGGLARAGASLTPLWLLALVFVPWLPFAVPSILLLWTGSMLWLLWAAVLVIMLATVPSGQFPRPSLASIQERPRLTAGVLAFLLFAFCGWQAASMIPGGDEPHYLVITQSLLTDGDIKIENNHRRGDYQAYYGGPLAPHYIQRGRNGEIYSIHAPGLSALVAPAFAVGGYRGVLLFLLLISACGSALAWHLAWLGTGKSSAAWFGWAAVTLSATTIFHSFSVYPDGVGSVIALTGVWALLRAEQERHSHDERLLPWLVHGAALALLPWLHSRFSLLAGCLGALVLLRLSSTKNPAGKAVAFLAIPAASAVAWLGFFVVIYGLADPSAPYGSTRDFSWAFVPGGLTGLLFDQRFGLIANAPVLAVGLVGLGVMLRIPRLPASSAPSAGLADRRLAAELMFVILPYLVTATSYAMWWAGWSAPARFANPAVPILAIPCAVAWVRIANRGSRAVAAGALALTVFIAAVLVIPEGGRLAYNTRETTALWLDWASKLMPLSEGLPVWYRGQEVPFGRDVAVWLAALGLAWVASRSMSSLPAFRRRDRLLTAIVGVFLVAAMTAVAVVWRLHGVSPIVAVSSQVEALSAIAGTPRPLTLQLTPPAVLSADRLASLFSIEPQVLRPSPGRRGNDPTIATLPNMPAGRYRVTVEGGGRPGWLMLGIGHDQFSLLTQPLTWPAAPIEIEWPIDVRALVVRGDEGARAAVRRLVVEPLSLVPHGQRLTDQVARRAVKYDTAAVFFLDERSFPEPDAFWLGGSRQTAFVVQPDRPQSSIALDVRNAPADNELTLESGQWRETLKLAPSEERRVEVPMAPGQRAVMISATTTSGFRPSETVPDSRDVRFLGAWVRVVP